MRGKVLFLYFPTESALGILDGFFRKAVDTFKSLRHVMRAVLSVRPKCSHRCVSRKETTLKIVLILTHATRTSTDLPSNHFIACAKIKAHCVIGAPLACHRENTPPM